jgi:hypothetical protein
MPKLKLINILKNKILEQGPFGIDVTARNKMKGNMRQSINWLCG